MHTFVNQSLLTICRTYSTFIVFKSPGSFERALVINTIIVFLYNGALTTWCNRSTAKSVGLSARSMNIWHVWTPSGLYPPSTPDETNHAPLSMKNFEQSSFPWLFSRQSFSTVLNSSISSTLLGYLRVGGVDRGQLTRDRQKILYESDQCSWQCNCSLLYMPTRPTSCGKRKHVSHCAINERFPHRCACTFGVPNLFPRYEMNKFGGLQQTSP